MVTQQQQQHKTKTNKQHNKHKTNQPNTTQTRFLQELVVVQICVFDALLGQPNTANLFPYANSTDTHPLPLILCDPHHLYCHARTQTHFKTKMFATQRGPSQCVYKCIYIARTWVD